jgi:serine/threonine protein kinase
LKIIKKARIMKLKQVQQVKDEFNLLSRLSHPFIVHVAARQVGMEGLIQDTRCLYYLLEYVGGGELLTFIRSSNTLPPPATA